MLKSFTNSGEDSAVPIEDFNILMSLVLLVKALSHFIDEEARKRVEPALALLISSTPLEQLVDSFKVILPPSHQSRLFKLSIYTDLQEVEGKFELDETAQLAKLKCIMELAFKRYGVYFLRYYADEVMINLNKKDLMDCPLALWNKATHGEDAMQLDFGPSFFVIIIKYQWGIIKDYHGISPDPTENAILYHSQLTNLFDFLFDQAQQLFLFVGALSYILNNDEIGMESDTDTNTLIIIYTEMMNHLDRICTGLNKSYDIQAQEGDEQLSLQEQMKFKQLTKVYILLLTLSVCSIQLSLTGPLHITTAPSISAVLEHYITNSDFTAPIKDCTILDDFGFEFEIQSSDLIRNYSMIRGISLPVLLHLERKDTKLTALNSGLSWNMLSLFVLIVTLLLLLLQFLRVLQIVWTILVLACQYFGFY